ncbi:MAG: hypothetical protein K0U66_08215, partial [Gammaproteobacteria bacterium]|nr:hypothetical protein [Gammaproteobacteria bacterium]
MLPQANQTYAPRYTHTLGRLKFLLALSYTIALMLPTCFTFSDVTRAGVAHAALLSDAPTTTLTTAPKGRATALQSPMQFEPEPTTLLFSSFLGGSGHETVTGMRLDTDNNAYLTGQTGSTDFSLFSPLNNTTLTGEPQTFVVQGQAPIDIAATLIPPDSDDSFLHLGDDQTWRVEWENNGPDPATGVQVVFEFEESGFPPSLQFKSIQNISGASNIDISSCSGPALSRPGGTLACAVSDIPVSQGQSSAALTFTPVTAEGYSLSVEMVGRGRDTNPSNNGNSFTGEIGNIPDTTLTVDFQGSGTGMVVATPGVSPAPTSTIFNDATLVYLRGTTVSLNATPTGLGANASVFNGWTGCDSVSGETCLVDMNTSRTIVPLFFDQANQAPTVNAGPDQSITLSAVATLNGTVTDDALPTPPTLTTTWSEVSGPGTVTFANTATVDTTATFSAPGTYVLRLTANDGAASTSDDVTITVSAIPAQRTLTVTKTPTAGGTVTGTGINCGSDCSHSVDEGTVITLTALPVSGFTFTGWTVTGNPANPCPGTSTCTVTMNADRTVTTTFTVNPGLRTLTVTNNPATGGTVTGTGINCGSDCSHSVDEGTVITLTALPVSGFTFTGWTVTGNPANPCPGTSTCTVTMNADRTVTTTFTVNPGLRTL